MYQPVGDRYKIRFDDAGRVFFRTSAADHTWLCALDFTDGRPRLVGAEGRDPRDGFQDAEIVEVAGGPAFEISEEFADCPAGWDDTEFACPTTQQRYRWIDGRYLGVWEQVAAHERRRPRREPTRYGTWWLAVGTAGLTGVRSSAPRRLADHAAAQNDQAGLRPRAR